MRYVFVEKTEAYTGCEDLRIRYLVIWANQLV